jgi:threonine dehydrogenase-like Zn-dependent dehydrogenase
VRDATDGQRRAYVGSHGEPRRDDRPGEEVGTQESIYQAIGSTRPGGHVGFVGVLHDVTVTGDDIFMSHAPTGHRGPEPAVRSEGI